MNHRNCILANLVIFNTITKTVFHEISFILFHLARLYIPVFMTRLCVHAKTKISQSLYKNRILRDKHRLSAGRKHLLYAFKRKYISLLVWLPTISLLVRVISCVYAWKDMYRTLCTVYPKNMQSFFPLLWSLKRRFICVYDSIYPLPIHHTPRWWQLKVALSIIELYAILQSPIFLEGLSVFAWLFHSTSAGFKWKELD